MLYVSILTGLWNWKRWTRDGIRERSLIVTPPLLIFGLVSSQTGFNHHMRYVLPAYPFLFIIAARTVTLGKFWKWFSYGCLTWQEKHPEAAPLNAAMFTMFDPKDIELKFKLPAPFVKGQPEVVAKDGLRGLQPGWYAVSAGR